MGGHRAGCPPPVLLWLFCSEGPQAASPWAPLKGVTGVIAQLLPVSLVVPFCAFPWGYTVCFGGITSKAHGRAKVYSSQACLSRGMGK